LGGSGPLTLLQAAKESEIMQSNKAKKHKNRSLSSGETTISNKDLSKTKCFSGLSIGPVTRTTNKDLKYQTTTNIVNSNIDKKLTSCPSSKAIDMSNVRHSANYSKSLQSRHIKGSIQTPIAAGSRLSTVPINDEQLQLCQVEAGEFVTMPLINQDAAGPTTTTSEISNSEV